MNARDFGFDTHTAWENFQETVKTKSYQAAINGTIYKDLKPETGDWTF